MTGNPQAGSRLLFIAAVAALLCSCGKHPDPAGVALPAVAQTLPVQPATGTHYAQSPWASVHRDSRNSDYVPLAVSTQVVPAWSALEGAALLVGPVIGPEGNLYVPSGRGIGTSHLHAFSRDGKLLWETPPMHSPADFDHAAVVSAPIVDPDGNVYASDSNQLWSFTAQGRMRWVADLAAHGVSGFFVTPVFSHEGAVGGISTDGKVAFFDRADGSLAFDVLDLPGVSGPPSREPPPGLWGGGLLAPEFIRPLWDLVYGREVEVANTPAVSPESGRIFITAGGASQSAGVLYGIDTTPEGLRLAFSAPMGAGSGTSPALSPDGSLVYAIDDDGLMVAIDAASGERAWETADTMGQASPTVGGDGTIYSFNGMQGTIVAIDGMSGALKWSRQYDDIARAHLAWRPFLDRTATVDCIITATANGLLAFLDLNYRLPVGEGDYPQPRKIVVVHLAPEDGSVLGWFEARDSSGAFVVPDVGGRLYLTLSAAATSISHYGVDPKLPWFLRAGIKPVGGLVAMVPSGAAR
ncbi:MAG: PQQ-binding-like beta-propeller repeat protein [Gammaproteobacteria bacterium]|nr:PQQ-binding-like beta-propeller repeat protein [Gammaproteobacteria bacterium]